jgi:hypothetical protein
VNYWDDVTQEAIDFIVEYAEIFEEGLVDEADFDYNDMDGLDSAFHESIVDRAYSLEDAAFVIEHTDNEETDSGLWEGQDMRSAMSACAAYSYGNDVWQEIDEQYDTLKDDYTAELDRITDARREELTSDVDVIASAKEDGIDLEDAVEEDLDSIQDDLQHRAAQNVITQFAMDHTIKPIDPVNSEAVYAIRRWLKLNSDAGMWGGYPVGSSYIDARCGVGYGMKEIKDYVDFDQRISYMLPGLRNKNREFMQQHLIDLEADLARRGQVV